MRLPLTARALALRARLAKSDPGNADWQYDLGISHERIGDVSVAQGDLAGALKSTERNGISFCAWSKRTPTIRVWQRDLSVAYDKIGDVLLAQGDLAGALQSYRADLAIAAWLAAKDASNAEWQYDLSVTEDRVGDVCWRKASSPRRLHPTGTALRSENI